MNESVREDRRDSKAARALHVHEEGVGALDQALLLVLALELIRGGVQKISFDELGFSEEKGTRRIDGQAWCELYNWANRCESL